MLSFKWTQEIHNDRRLHIIYLEVKPSKQDHGISGKLIGEVLHYTKEHGLIVSLKTHNVNNLDLYQHFGFELFDVVEKYFDLK